MPSYKFEIYADCYSFFIQDEASDSQQISWSRVADDRRLAIAPGVVAVGTVYSDMVDVAVDLLDVMPPINFDRWDHVVECSISISSGRIFVKGWLGDSPDAFFVNVCPGCYRVRVNYSILESASLHSFKDKGAYVIQLWPAEAMEPVVLKQCG